uniref:ZAD domain-containing protein n=1 Tax=Culex tarsalis TaxID=7177 RepID=A0A1Q3F0L1_CULTA
MSTANTELEPLASCTLCQAEDRPLTSLISTDAKARQLRRYIRDCLKVMINSEDDKNTRICADCGEKLQSFNWFYHQGQANDVFLKQQPEGTIPADEPYCRLCLGLKSNMYNVFPPNGQPDNPLCEIIAECVGVNLSFYQDFGALICPSCHTQLESLTTFKRISKQILLDIGDSESNVSVGQPEAAGQPGPDPESLLEVMSVEPEPTKSSPKSNGKKRKKQPRQVVEAKQVKVEPEPQFSNSSVAFAKTGRQRVFRMLRVADDDRNFEVIKETKGRAKVTIDGYRFVISSEKKDGTSVWNCEWKVLHNCKYTITIDANTKFATFPKGMVHPHEPETRLLKCPFGRGNFLQDDGTEDPFWLLGESGTNKQNERHLIYQNQRYVLRSINAMNDTSEWECKMAKCNARVEIIGIFKFISLASAEHGHTALSGREVRQALQASRLNVDSKDVVTPFRKQALSEEEFKKLGRRRTEFSAPAVYTKMASEDPDRNYDTFKIKENLFKVRFQQYGYKYYLKLGGGATLWKCIWEGLHNCNAMVQISPDTKRAELWGAIQHNHPATPAPIFDCDLTKYSVRSITSTTDETMELLVRECQYFESRSLVYRKHIYNLNQVVNQTETRWSCVKAGTNGQMCPASLIINGMMESFLHKGLHCDPALSDSQLRNIILPGNILDLSVQQDILSSSDGSEPDEPSQEPPPDVLIMLKQQLFNFALGRATIWDKQEGKIMPFYFLKDTAKQDDDGAYLLFYQKHRYSFASIDEYGVSQWICSKLLQPDAQGVTCTAHITVEGVFQRLLAKGSHNHEGAAMLEHVYKPEEDQMMAGVS